MVRAFTRLLMVAVLLAGLGLAAGFWWLYSPMTLNLPAGSQVLDLEIEPGTRPAQVAQAVVASGAQTPVQLLQWWFRVSGQARQIKAGSYEITPGMTPRKLLAMLVRGDQSLKSITLVEGWNFRQVREALQKAELLAQDSMGLEPEMIMEKLGRPGIHPEGRFFPDTYTYAKGSSDLAILKRAAKAMAKPVAAPRSTGAAGASSKNALRRWTRLTAIPLVACPACAPASMRAMAVRKRLICSAPPASDIGPLLRIVHYLF